MKNLRFYSLTLLLLLIAGASFSNDCGTAIMITPRLALNQSPVSGNFVSETFSGASQCAGPDGRADVWYRFTAQSSNMFVKVTGTNDLDLALEVVNSCGGTILACENSSGAGASETAGLSNLVIGNTYYFRTYHVGESAAESDSFTAAVSYIPTVQLRPDMCGITDFTTNDILQSTQPPNRNQITYYQWRFEELEPPYNVYERISPNPQNPNFRLFWLGPIGYNRSYSVSIRVAIGSDDGLGDYGPACIIQMQENVLSTQLQAQYSNATLEFCDVIGADAIGGADRYRWEFSDFTNTLNVYGDNSQRLLRVNKIPGLKRGQIYIVKVFAQHGGMESPVGESRFVSVNAAVPATGLRTDLYPCGGTYPINMQVQANEICTAENYTWRFRNTSQPQADLIYTRTGGNRFIRLDWITGLIPGDSYNLDVKARQGGKNGVYSSVCNITIAPPTNGIMEQMYAIGDEESAYDYGTENDIYVEVENIQSEMAIEMVLLNNGSAASEGILFDVASADVDNDTKFELYDLNGRLIAERSEYVVREGNRISWQIPGFTSGIYLLRAINGQNVVTQKVSVF